MYLVGYKLVDKGENLFYYFIFVFVSSAPTSQIEQNKEALLGVFIFFSCWFHQMRFRNLVSL